MEANVEVQNATASRTLPNAEPPTDEVVATEGPPVACKQKKNKFKSLFSRLPKTNK